MRELTEEENTKVCKKLEQYIGNRLKELLEAPNKLFLHNKRIYITTEDIYKRASIFGREKLVGAGIVIGKFTKSEKFRLSITSLHLLSKYAIHKVWIKSSAEMNFLYENNIIKGHILKISDDVPRNGVVFVFNHMDVPLGFGVTTKSSMSLNISDSNNLIVIRQADTGEYIRNENTLV
ncbi:60S ribosome subunit biogenesis protein NIP7 [Astathelohania contejeani]|uniref:60S ribosome subunit biogenesis protein NIP7 n=1 Tax=Astathelohania contejeani TaxID=164912 RepID=A0ABQ7I076_9MICR|nr:60S ribosome subunit biogenesis protein NIP7 [Thelohania contejeani]